MFVQGSVTCINNVTGQRTFDWLKRVRTDSQQNKLNTPHSLIFKECKAHSTLNDYFSEKDSADRRHNKHVMREKSVF